MLLLRNVVQFNLQVLKLKLCQSDFMRISHTHLSVNWQPDSLALLNYLVFSILLSVETHSIIKNDEELVL